MSDPGPNQGMPPAMIKNACYVKLQQPYVKQPASLLISGVGPGIVERKANQGAHTDDQGVLVSIE